MFLDEFSVPCFLSSSNSSYSPAVMDPFLWCFPSMLFWTYSFKNTVSIILKNFGSKLLLGWFTSARFIPPNQSSYRFLCGLPQFFLAVVKEKFMFYIGELLTFD